LRRVGMVMEGMRRVGMVVRAERMRSESVD
jgi:hypothetical protein